MATIPKANIVTGNTVLATDVKTIIDALDGTTAYDIVIPGTLGVTGAATIGGGSPAAFLTNSSSNSFKAAVDANSYYLTNNVSGTGIVGNYIESKFAAQVMADAATGRVILRTAISGTAGNPVTWIDQLVASTTGVTVSGTGKINNTSRADLYLNRAAVPTTGTNLGVIFGGAYRTGTTEQTSTSIRTVATENWSAAAAGAKLEFYTTPNTTISDSLVLTLGQDLSATFVSNLIVSGKCAVAGATISDSTGLVFPVSTTALSSLRIPHGSAPTTPVNGDVWTTTSGIFVRINGTTVGPLT